MTEAEYGLVETPPPEAPKKNPPLVHFYQGSWVFTSEDGLLHCVKAERNIRVFIGACGDFLYYPEAPNGTEKGRCPQCESAHLKPTKEVVYG